MIYNNKIPWMRNMWHMCTAGLFSSVPITCLLFFCFGFSLVPLSGLLFWAAFCAIMLSVIMILTYREKRKDKKAMDFIMSPNLSSDRNDE